MHDGELMALALGRKHSEEFTEPELKVFSEQLGYETGFTGRLMKLIYSADNPNRDRLAKGFPELVLAVRSWTDGNLATRLRAHKEADDAVTE